MNICMRKIVKFYPKSLTLIQLFYGGAKTQLIVVQMKAAKLKGME